PKGGMMITFGGNRTFAEMVTHAQHAGFQMLDVLVFEGGGAFAKSRTTLMPRHEIAALMRRPGPVREINPLRNRSNVFRLGKPRSEGMKPLEWMDECVRL